MIILAIDSGFDRTGYSFFKKTSSSNFRYITSGTIQTKKTESIELRLRQIYEEVTTLIKKNKPDIVVIEQLFFFKNQKTAFKVSQSQGVILLAASQNNLKVEYLTPLQVKQIITGYGQADKKSVQKMLMLTLKLDKKIKLDDEADAIACGLAYCYQKADLV
jgi:crossover junction endodeoxyribonuclease RuvC